MQLGLSFFQFGFPNLYLDFKLLGVGLWSLLVQRLEHVCDAWIFVQLIDGSSLVRIQGDHLADDSPQLVTVNFGNTGIFALIDRFG